MKNNTILAARIKSVRQESGMTQEQAAEDLGISRSTLANWETGTRKPTASELVHFCRTFAVTFDYMCGRSTDAKQLAPQTYEIDWSLLSPFGRMTLYKIYEAFSVAIPFCSMDKKKH